MSALYYVSEDLRNDRELVIAAVEQNGDALEYASEDLRNGRELVMKAVEQYGDALRYASEDFEIYYDLLVFLVMSSFTVHIVYNYGSSLLNCLKHI